MTTQHHADLLEDLLPIIRAAGDVVMAVYRTDFAVRGKDDASPVTEADERAEALILPALEALLPGTPIVAEEAVAAGALPRWANVSGWSTARRHQGVHQPQRRVLVNIALIEHGTPVLGAVLAPALGRLFAGRVGAGAFVEEGGERRRLPAAGCRPMASRSWPAARMATPRRWRRSLAGARSPRSRMPAPRSSSA
ncbi:3'(2'),5'-bisphosphate nucleotidase CysQ family protein [Thauera humireducens]|uniref:3'(2'),5'-bisphosphate nucleotidase CysQ family protein n=1 Tax=Thauera humireducens TaxID=1134435 RepID=UPI00311EA856